MPVDPQIANGLIPFGEGVARSMAMGAELADRRRQTDLYANRLAMAGEESTYARQQDQQEAERRKQLEDIARTLPGVRNRDPGALSYAYQSLSEDLPWFAGVPDEQKPLIAEEIMMRAIGEKPEQPLTLEQESGPFGSRIVKGSDGRWQIVEPPRPTGGGDGGQTAAQRDFQYYLSLTPEQQAVYDRVHGKGASAKPLPTSALRITDEARQAMAAASDSQKLIDDALATLESGKVQLGVVNNVAAQARNLAGRSTEETRAYVTIKQTFEKLRNNYLLLAKGVQTEGDAQRAWNSEVGEAVQFDNALAKQQLERARAMNERMMNAQQMRIDSTYANFGQEAPGAAPPPAAAPAGPQPAPVPGVTKEDGYIYVGGDPGKRSSWVKER